ncbi:hypothetical protein DL770_009311 [Monosporascus sp. CRB-9-2]|nr:hypothetical protein DL770_009311 [Monosporascus sp. CRB-9-2]
MMRRIKDTLNRLTRSSRSSIRDESSVRLEKSGQSISSHGSLETMVSTPEGKGAIILHDGARDADDGMDIVLVHDLFGHRIANWFQRGICWPRDLLKDDFQNARIITWGWTGPFGSTNAFSDQAEALLTDIAGTRTDTSRPIVFVGHGIGGLVIKEALVTAAMSRIYGSHHELGNVYPKTVGVIFLGTPHSNSGKQSLGEVISTAAQMSVRQPSNQLLRLLRESSEMFENQRDTFALVSRDIQVVCIRAKLSMPTGQMISKASASYDGLNVRSDEFLTNHVDLARFESRQDAGYQKLIRHITQLSATPKPHEAKETRNQEILDALYFDSINDREEKIHEAYGQTCDWILSAKDETQDESPFYSWLTAPQSIFWVSGRAGSGKSTLMKHAFHSERTRQELEEWSRGGDLLIASVFLFEGGSHIQKSREGILRSVLYQILTQRRDLIAVAFPSFFGCEWPPAAPFNTVINLSQAFYSLFAHDSQRLKLCIFVDGLDEYRIMDRKDYYTDADFALVYDGDEGDAGLGSSRWINESHMDISRVINEMGSKDTIKLCVSSRELAIFEEAFADHPRLRVHTHSETSIAQYVAGRLEEAVPGMPNMASLCREIAHKSHGDVLWARLAIDMVLEGSLKTLRSTLDSLPSQLGGTEGLYMLMIQNLPHDDRADAYKIFELVLRAEQPPSLITLAFAVEGYLADPATRANNPAQGKLRISQDRLHEWTAEDIQRICDQMQRRLQTHCASLLDVESGPLEAGQRVVFMHQTAKEFAARKDVWAKVLTNQPTAAELDISLLSGCIRHIQIFEALRPPVSAWPEVRFLPEAWLLIANALRYAGRIDNNPPDFKSYCELLNEMDQTIQQAWVTSLRRHVPLYDDTEWFETKCPALCSKHWAGYEPMETGKSPKRKDFLALAVQANLVNYVAARLKAMPEHQRRSKAQDLLDYAVSPKAEGFSACVALSGDYVDFHHDMPDSRFLDLLFDSGADPREGPKLWLKAFKTGRQYFSRQNMTMSQLMQSSSSSRLMQNRQRWVAAVRALLMHGADPNATIETRSATPDDHSSYETKTAIELIREMLEGEPEYAVELAELDALTGRRPSMAAVAY